jgi:serine/threonine protein kinase
MQVVHHVYFCILFVLSWPQQCFTHPLWSALLLCLRSKSICYADLKPANIMFSEGNECPTSPRAHQAPHLQVRAVDFGCSRVATKGRPLTQCCGSPLYMAPEMALQRFGVGVDMWAAGVMVGAPASCWLVLLLFADSCAKACAG